MKSPHYKRLLSMFLAAGMTLSLMPNVYAEETDSDPVDVVEETTEETESDESVSQDSNVEESETVEEDETPDVSVLLDSTEEKTHEVFSTTNSTIAPGVTQSINYAYSADGKQMVYYVATADVTRNDVIVQSSYKDAQCENLGMSKLTEQMAAANSVYSDPNNEKYISDYYTAVAGVNASFYNMTTGQPMGYTVLDGKYFGTDSYDNFFAILKDGSAVIDYRSNLSKYEENVWQAVGGSQMLVYNGQDVTANVSGSYNTDRHSRTCVGVTADGKVVMMVLDGRQEPFSCGGSMHELAQIMLEQGCVTAINLDGGGSTTYAARQEGANEVTVVNRPSDGSERSISSGLIIASLAAPSDVFERATLTAEHNYVTPNSVVNVTATGVSPAGTAAQIPESATWESTLGTIDENGTFTSDGTLGDAKISMLVDGVVVGETTIHVVNPDGLEFSNASITVPYGKSVNLNIKATYGKNKVYYNVDDLEFELEDDSVGTIEGLKFTAIEEDEDITSSLITAFLKANEEINCSAQILLGKGSETVADFEENDGAIKDYTIGTGYPQYGPAGANGQNECGSIKVVTKENGKVHDGDYALAVECDFSQAYETGYHMLSLSGLNIKAPAKATAIGMWIYIPELEEISTTSMRLTGKTEGSATNDVTSPWLWENCEPYGWSNNGWRYVSMDLTGYDADITFNTLQIYICDRDNSDVGFYFKENASVNGKFTYYIDSITVDYSEAVEDREAPVFENITYADGTMSDATVLNGQTATTSKVSFAVNVEDDTTKDNSTGLDENSAKAYIDGVETTCKFNGKTMSIEDAVLADGVHTIKFEIVDKLGNSAYVTKQITVKANSNMSTV
ncbi:MAG: phosphodiester glycosidase family protein, partial [Erysipelotrichaceae bacterium]|nr:phosphodiester glycosidase family protein [Erysipelotrichaceae bacterium]